MPSRRRGSSIDSNPGTCETVYISHDPSRPRPPFRRHSRHPSQHRSWQTRNLPNRIAFLLASALTMLVQAAPFALTASLLLLTPFLPRPYSIIVCVFLLYALTEGLFLLYQWRFAQTHQRLLKPPEFTKAARQRLFRHCVAHAADIRSVISGWFFGAPANTIGRENLADWIAWAFFSVDPIHLSEREHEEMEGYVNEINTLLGHTLQPGRNPRAKCIRLSLDSFTIIPRPLAYYAGVALANRACGIYMRRMSFERVSYQGWEVWIRKGCPSPADKSGPPIVLAHGLSAGLFPYMDAIRRLAAQEPGRTLLVLHLPYIAGGFPTMRKVPGQEDIIPPLLALFHKRRLPPAVWLGHSFGTITMAWAIKMGKGLLVSRGLFVDPVCFALWEPELVYNFVFRPPTNWMEALVRYFVGRECGVARVIARHFWWSQNVLMGGDVPSGSKIFLSGRDGIINAYKVEWYLERFSISTKLIVGMRHAEWLVRPSVRDEILRCV